MAWMRLTQVQIARQACTLLIARAPTSLVKILIVAQFLNPSSTMPDAMVFNIVAFEQGYLRWIKQAISITTT